MTVAHPMAGKRRQQRYEAQSRLAKASRKTLASPEVTPPPMSDAELEQLTAPALPPPQKPPPGKK